MNSLLIRSQFHNQITNCNFKFTIFVYNAMVKLVVHTSCSIRNFWFSSALHLSCNKFDLVRCVNVWYICNVFYNLRYLHRLCRLCAAANMQLDWIPSAVSFSTANTAHSTGAAAGYFVSLRLKIISRKRKKKPLIRMMELLWWLATNVPLLLHIG